MKDEWPTYAVRIRPSAQAELRGIYERLLRLRDLSEADQWYSVLRFILADLAANPWSYAPCRVSRLLRSEVRAVLHQVGPESAVYRILFILKEDDDEERLVYILSVRRTAPETTARAEEDYGEEVSVVQERMADRIAGDKGVLLEDYRAEVMAKREARKLQRMAETPA